LIKQVTVVWCHHTLPVSFNNRRQKENTDRTQTEAEHDEVVHNSSM